MKRKKTSVYRGLCLAGSFLLLLMAVFHGSGFWYVSDTIMKSNADGFLKEIVPVLFAHPSVHLAGLAAFGILALFLQTDAKRVLLLLSALVVLDALLAFYLGGTLPGMSLLLGALCFIVANYFSQQATID
ncbi:hypothetical protein [Pelagihabitans pacificus]|uniref:hypothetical protein n=1 Tax=Pelagihabitans pacificus TaxID=2696054 RepID=UPI00140C1F39|nr:hypothetical protein [Pelagihabitans pacificus]